MDANDIQWPHLQAVMERYGETWAALYKRNMEESGRPASGALADSIATEVKVDDRSIGVEVSLLEYWKYIEHGTRPHWAPIAPLKEWVRVKPLLPRPMANGKLPTPDQLAYMVRWKIHEEGTEGKDDFSRALQETWAQFAQEVADAVTADIAADLDWVLRMWLVA